MYRLSPVKQKMVDRIAQIADRRIAPHAAQTDRDGTFPRQSINALGEAGFLGLTVPTAFGGMEQGFFTMAAGLEEVAQRCASTAMVYLMHLCGVACYAATPAKTAPLLKAAARGQHLSTIAFSESASRSHFWAPVSRAAAVNGSWLLNTHKSFVTSAGEADGYVVSMLDPGATKGIESTIFLTLRGDTGIAVTSGWNGLGMRGNASAPMTFTDVRVGPERVLSPPGKGLDMILGTVLPAFQVGSAAVALGIAESAIAATQRHLTSTRFEHLNTSLAELPTLRARLAQMRIETDRARAHLVSVLTSLEHPDATTEVLVLEAKATATEAAVSVTELALRACGGAAFAGTLGLDRLFRDARAPIVMAPTTDQAYDFIGRALCGLELLA